PCVLKGTGQRERYPEGRTGCRIPEPRRPVHLGRHDNLAVSAKLHHFVPAGLRKTCDGLARCRVPKLGVPLIIRLLRKADEAVAIRDERTYRVRARELHDLPGRLARVGIPQAHRAVETAGEDGMAVGAEGHGENPTLMLKRADELACGGVP